MKNLTWKQTGIIAYVFMGLAMCSVIFAGNLWMLVTLASISLIYALTAERRHFTYMKASYAEHLANTKEKKLDPIRDLPIALDYRGDPKSDWRVVSAANRHKPSGLIIAGARHFDNIMRAQIFSLQGFDMDRAAAANWEGMHSSEDWKDLDQGFIDNYGDFLTREEAWHLANYNDQIIQQEQCGHEGYLFSENLY
jgi:hypothetical protein